MIRDYYYLTKPGIVYGNAVTTAAGFLFASGGVVDIVLFFGTVVGVCGIVAASCVLNNYIDRDIDLLMARTRDRALVTGAISLVQAIFFAFLLFLVGVGLLIYFTNFIVLTLTLAGLGVYIVLYSLWSKRQTTYATLVGSLAGAIPPLVGYVSASGAFDTAAVLIFLIYCLWQMPHFYAIALYRLEDYSRAGVPVLPLRLGFHTTKVHMLIFTLLFIITASLLPLYSHASLTYLAVVVLLGGGWLYFGVRGFSSHDNTVWGKQMFVYSIVVNMGLSVALAANSFFAF